MYAVYVVRDSSRPSKNHKNPTQTNTMSIALLCTLQSHHPNILAYFTCRGTGFICVTYVSMFRMILLYQITRVLLALFDDKRSRTNLWCCTCLVQNVLPLCFVVAHQNTDKKMRKIAEMNVLRSYVFVFVKSAVVVDPFQWLSLKCRQLCVKSGVSFLDNPYVHWLYYTICTEVDSFVVHKHHIDIDSISNSRSGSSTPSWSHSTSFASTKVKTLECFVFVRDLLVPRHSPSFVFVKHILFAGNECL